jgi:hypothetical protein
VTEKDKKMKTDGTRKNQDSSRKWKEEEHQKRSIGK